MSRLASTQNFALYDTCPIGAIIAFPAAAVPNGWLECNGQAISRANYTELFALISTTYGTGDGSSTFNLPDYRGVFLRGKDNGKGYDAGRALGTFQDQDVQPHLHPVTYIAALAGTGSGQGNIGTANQATIGTSTQNSTGTETRPKNVSVVFCIKARNIIVTNLSTVSTYAALTHTTHQGEAVSFTSIGYKKFADGAILQWGATGVSSGGQMTVVFPLAFPNIVYSVIATTNSVSAYISHRVAALATTSFTIYESTAVSNTYYWQAIGR